MLCDFSAAYYNAPERDIIRTALHFSSKIDWKPNLRSGNDTKRRDGSASGLADQVMRIAPKDE
jgi:hypothetical protein